MRNSKRTFSIALILIFLTGAAFAQGPSQQGKKQAIAPAATTNPVVGSGTPGQITKWTGVDGSNTYTLGDSNIFEDKFGKVGIGTRTPTSLLTVQGMIETTLGGYKFPDGTVQTTAFNPNQVVRSLNGLTGNVTLAAGANITITPSGNTLTIAAANALTGVAHDATLQGNGTLASPLGVAVPLSLTGSIPHIAVFSATNGSNGDGVDGESRDGMGVFGNSTGGDGVGGHSISGAGVFGESSNGTGVRGASFRGDGVHGDGGTSTLGAGGVGVVANGGSSDSGRGGDGVSAKGGGSTSNLGGFGVNAIGGFSLSGAGGTGVNTVGGASSGAGLFGGDGIFAARGLGSDGAIDGRAGAFVGDVAVAGKLTKTMGTFKIDHPLDPENKYLYHSFVESPDMMNIYNGNITTDANGDAVVEMPNYFDALNKDFRYQLTVIGQFAQAIVAGEMQGNRFVIKTNAPGVKVSWQVTGVRHDAYAEKNRVQVEEDKSEKERGSYLHPEVFNQPEEKSVEWARHPELMQKLKQQRLEAEEKMKKQQ